MFIDAQKLCRNRRDGEGGVKVQGFCQNDRPPSHIFTHAKLKI
ncbi:hypothetical protein ACINNAV21_2072 [Acinetobacter baumannii Naval-21]|nr:hypothetical protein ACINNAV21_2072 [Acinetobacter baumannii Naval-21]